MTRDITVIGAGGFGRETLDVLAAAERAAPGSWNVLGVVDDSPSTSSVERLARHGTTWLGSMSEWLAGEPTSEYVIAIGSPETRAALARVLDSRGLRAATLIHPGAEIGTGSSVGAGSVVCGGSQVSTGVELGRHVHLNPNTTIGHDARLSDFVSVNPGAVVSGAAVIGERSLIGAGAVVLQELQVGAGSTVGAAACVVRDVLEGSTVKGVPAT